MTTRRLLAYVESQLRSGVYGEIRIRIKDGLAVKITEERDYLVETLPLPAEATTAHRVRSSRSPSLP